MPIASWWKESEWACLTMGAVGTSDNDPIIRSKDRIVTNRRNDSRRNRREFE